MSGNEDLERTAAEQDPSASAEEKAAALRSPLDEQVAESERRADDELDSAAAAPDHAAAGVAEHEREMQRRGFEKQGPPE